VANSWRRLPRLAAIDSPTGRRYAAAIFGSSRASFSSRPGLFVAGLAAVVALLAGCGDDDDNDTTTPAPSAGGGAVTPGVYVGQVQGTDDSIALVTEGHRLSGAYLCIPQSSQWIRPSPFTKGKAPLVARRGVVLGSVTFSGDTASGQVTAGGQRPFSAQLATGDAGLYRTTSGTANQPGFSETGWIVLPDGNGCGSTNTITAGGGFQSEQAPSEPEGDAKVTDFANPFPF
jgi:hypothetical protein